MMSVTRSMLSRVASEPVLRLFDFQPEALHVRGFVQERTPFVGRHAQDFIDEALAHDRVAVLADIALHQQVDDVAQADAGAVQEVFGVAVAVDAARRFRPRRSPAGASGPRCRA